jgi:hypothetical protein
MDIGAVEPIGILKGSDGKPSLILYQCRCENTRAIPWEEAPEEIQEKAMKQECGKGPLNAPWEGPLE